MRLCLVFVLRRLVCSACGHDSFTSWAMLIQTTVTAIVESLTDLLVGDGLRYKVGLAWHCAHVHHVAYCLLTMYTLLL